MNNTFENNNSFEDKRLENTLENRIAEKVHGILDDASDNPKKYARLILTKDHSVFIKPGYGPVGVKEAVITIHKNGQTKVFHIVPKSSSADVIAVIRNNKYVVFAFSFNGDQKEYLFETLRKDRSVSHSFFSALLHTEIGTISLICDSRHEKFFYSEFYELGEEPNFYSAMLETIMEAGRNTAQEVIGYEQEEQA
jgi:hypothetical protein